MAIPNDPSDEPGINRDPPESPAPPQDNAAPAPAPAPAPDPESPAPPTDSPAPYTPPPISDEQVKRAEEAATGDRRSSRTTATS